MAETEGQTKAPKRVLIVMAHPDDGEFIAGGTIAKWASEGRDIYYCLVTDGQVGDAGDTEREFWISYAAGKAESSPSRCKDGFLG